MELKQMFGKEILFLLCDLCVLSEAGGKKLTEITKNS